jgi:ATP-dependent Clp protease ATP-binding subunit ClpB
VADRFLPDKAIDLIDEAAAGLEDGDRLRPHRGDEMQRRVTQLEIERQALKRETIWLAGPARQAREGARRLNEQLQAMKARWQSEKDVITRIAGLKERSSSQAEAERAQRERPTSARRCSSTTRCRSSRRARGRKRELAELQKDGALLKEEVSEEDIAAIVSKWTGVPVAKMLEARCSGSSTSRPSCTSA